MSDLEATPEPEAEVEAFDPFAGTDIDFDDAPAASSEAPDDVADAPEAEASEKAEAPDDGPQRDENGRFKAKADAEQESPAETEKAAEPEKAEDKPTEPPTNTEPPSRFSAEAKEAWQRTPLSVRRETERTFRELSDGIERNRAQMEDLKPFIQMAGDTKQLSQALKSYTGIEQTLRQNPVEGLDAICRNLGTDLRSIAAHVLGQKAPERDEVTEGLRREIAELKQQVSGVHETTQTHSQRLMQNQVAEWAATKPRFDELAGAERNSIQEFVQRGYPLDEAYDLADRLNPRAAAQTGTPEAQTLTPAPAAHTRSTANLSVAGAPAGGSNPPAKLPGSKNNADLAAIFDQFGIA